MMAAVSPKLDKPVSAWSSHTLTHIPNQEGDTDRQRDRDIHRDRDR